MSEGRQWREAVAWVRDRYPEDIFLPDSDSPDAKAASMARRTCDNIVHRYGEAYGSDMGKPIHWRNQVLTIVVLIVAVLVGVTIGFVVAH